MLNQFYLIAVIIMFSVVGLHVLPKAAAEDIKPQMGWVFTYYSHGTDEFGPALASSDTLSDFPGLSTVYFQVPWSYIEPQEDQYNWALLDGPAQRWIENGKKVAFRITASDKNHRWATPEWVRNAGAEGTFFTYPEGPVDDQTNPSVNANWAPDYNDAVFLQHLDDLLAAMSERYNDNDTERYQNNADVAFIDLGTYGLEGSGDTSASSQLSESEHEQAVQTQIDMYKSHFPDTLLVINDDVEGPEGEAPYALADYARNAGFTLRDDSILVEPAPDDWHHADMAEDFWREKPVILGIGNYEEAKAKGVWDNPDRLLEAVKKYHASYVTVNAPPHDFLTEQRDVIDAINERLGYQLELRNIDYPSDVYGLTTPFDVEFTWANAGVAPCYPGGYITLTLKNSDSDVIMAVLTDSTFNVKDLDVNADGSAPETTHTATFVAQPARSVMLGAHFLPKDTTRTYDLYISVGQRDGTPRIPLDMPDDDGHMRYKIGQITINK